MEVSSQSTGGFSCLSVAPCPECVPARIPAPAVHVTSSDAKLTTVHRDSSELKFMFSAASLRSVVAQLSAGGVFLPAQSY